MNDTSVPDFTKPFFGLKPFPAANEVFAPDEMELAEHLHPLFSIDASVVNPNWTGVLHMLSPIESHEGLPGDLTQDLGIHGPLLKTNWIGFKVENGRYRLCGEHRYFFLHKDNRDVPEPLPGSRDSLVAHYKDQHESYLLNVEWYRQHGTISRIDWGDTEPIAFVGQLGGTANGNDNWVTIGDHPVQVVPRPNSFPAAFPLSPQGRHFHHVASVPGWHYRQFGADNILMFYEPVEQLVLFTFDF